MIAILITLFGAWFNYASALPAISAKVELVEPLAPGQPMHFKVNLDNNGRTTAKHLSSRIEWKFARADVPFEPTYEGQAPANWTAPVSDLPPGGHSTITSTNQLSLAHDHDVNAVLSGDWNFFLYGKIPYRDILYIPHELHFCGVYRQVPGADPLKLIYCTSYNETD
jgi:hypothetical protein